MAAAAGRDLRIKYDPGTGAVVIAGATTDTWTRTREGIPTTDKDDVGATTYLADALGVHSYSASVSGNLVDSTLRDLADGDTSFADDFEIQVAGDGTYAGSWGIINFNCEGAEGATTLTFTCDIVSNGAITFTAA